MEVMAGSFGDELMTSWESWIEAGEARLEKKFAAWCTDGGVEEEVGAQRGERKTTTITNKDISRERERGEDWSGAFLTFVGLQCRGGRARRRRGRGNRAECAACVFECVCVCVFLFSVCLSVFVCFFFFFEKGRETRRRNARFLEFCFFFFSFSFISFWRENQRSSGRAPQEGRALWTGSRQ